MNGPTVFIIILNYSSLEDTLGCVESIRQIEYSNLRVLVIDNASPDGSGKILQNRLPANEFIQLPTNIGYAGGNNEGIRRGIEKAADYIFIVNPDVRLPADSIRSYVRILEEDKTISALNPIQLSADGTTIDKLFARAMFTNNGYPIPKLTHISNQKWDVQRLFGAALFLPIQTIANIGAFDPLYFAYWEEVDLSRRILYHGGRLVVTEESPIFHLRTINTKVIDDTRLFLRLRGQYLFMLKDPDLPFGYLSKAVFKDLLRHLYVQSNSDFPWRRRHYLKVICWIIMQFHEIKVHRGKDRAGRAYI